MPPGMPPPATIVRVLPSDLLRIRSWAPSGSLSTAVHFVHSGRSAATAAHPRDAGGDQENYGLVPLQRPVALRRLVRDGLVVRGADARHAVVHAIHRALRRLLVGEPAAGLVRRARAES